MRAEKRIARPEVENAALRVEVGERSSRGWDESDETYLLASMRSSPFCQQTSPEDAGPQPILMILVANADT